MFPFYQLSTKKELSLRIVASFCNDGVFSFRLANRNGNRFGFAELTIIVSQRDDF